MNKLAPLNETVERINFFLNMSYHQLRWGFDDRSPIAVTWKLTTRCTLHCRHCPWLEKKYPDLSADRCKELILYFKKRDVYYLVFEGGEPTLHKDLQELIEFGQNLGMEVTVVTNCTRSLGSFSPDIFLISIDGLWDEHDKLRGPGAFKRLLNNLSTTNIHKRALVSLSRDNVNQIDDILSFFSPLLDSFWFSFIYDYKEKNNSVALGSEEKKAVGAKLLSLKKDYPIVNSRNYLRKVGTSRKCKDWLLSTVTADGQIQSGCVVSAIEACRCDECELACHRELSDYIGSKIFLCHLLINIFRFK